MIAALLFLASHAVASPVCDGSTDDAAALQSCIDQSLVKGVPCALPAGICLSKSPLTIPNGGGLIGSGSSGVSGTILRLQTDGGGPCALGRNGALRLFGGNSTKLLANLRVEGADAGLGCLINASAASGQVAGARIEDADLLAPSGSSSTVGLFVGNIVTSRVQRVFFAQGFATAVLDGGQFSNSLHFRDDFFDEPSGDAYMVDLGTISASDFTGCVFESGPNGLRLRAAAGVTLSDNWFGDLKRTGGTWLNISGAGTSITANHLNCEGPGARQTAIRLSGRGAHVVMGNWIDGARVGVTSAGNANIVKGNSIFYPEETAVDIVSGSRQEIGPNDIKIGGGRVAVRCAEADCAKRHILK